MSEAPRYSRAELDRLLSERWDGYRERLAAIVGESGHSTGFPSEATAWDGSRRSLIVKDPEALLDDVRRRVQEVGMLAPWAVLDTIFGPAEVGATEANTQQRSGATIPDWEVRFAERERTMLDLLHAQADALAELQGGIVSISQDLTALRLQLARLETSPRQEHHAEPSAPPVSNMGRSRWGAWWRRGEGKRRER